MKGLILYFNFLKSNINLRGQDMKQGPLENVYESIKEMGLWAAQALHPVFNMS